MPGLVGEGEARVSFRIVEFELLFESRLESTLLIRIIRFYHAFEFVECVSSSSSHVEYELTSIVSTIRRSRRRVLELDETILGLHPRHESPF